MRLATEAWSAGKGGLLSVALSYASQGCPVLPLIPGGKKPLGRLVPHGMKNASTNASQVQRWWSEEPFANVGVICGPASFEVLDVDGREGIATLRRLVAEHGRITTRVNQTPRGFHLLFKPGSLPSSVGQIGPGLDTRGSGTGYIVAPGSVGESGVAYRVAVVAELASVPEWLSKQASEAASASRRRRGDTGEAARRVRQAPQGTRNTVLNKESFVVSKDSATDSAAEEAVSKLVSVSTLPRAEAERTAWKAARAGRAVAVRARERFRRVPVALERDPRFIGRTVEAKCIALLICTGPDATAIPGVRVSTLAALASAASISEERAHDALRELSKRGLVRSDTRSGVFWLPAVTERFRPTSPNEVKAWRNALAYGIPRCRLRYEIEIAVLGQLGAETAILTRPALKIVVDKGEGPPL